MTPEGGEWNDATDWSSATPAPLMNTPLRYPIGAYVDYMRPSIVTNKYVVMCKFVCVRVVLLCLCRVGNVSKTDVIYTTAQTEHTHTLSDTQPSPNVQPHTTIYLLYFLLPINTRPGRSTWGVIRTPGAVVGPVIVL